MCKFMLLYSNDVNGLFLCYCTKPTQVQAVRQPPPYGHRTNMAYKHPNVQQRYCTVIYIWLFLNVV